MIGLDPSICDSRSPLGAPIVLQRRGTVFGASMPMITELVNDSNVQVGEKPAQGEAIGLERKECTMYNL